MRCGYSSLHSSIVAGHAAAEAAASLLVAVIGDASLGLGLNAALQCMLPGIQQTLGLKLYA